MRSADKKTIIFNMDAGTVTVNGKDYHVMKNTLGFKLLEVLYSVKRD
ncbi:MAG: hypothetical protein HRT44_13770 [Bdellovibrionales bacterium]|nr:hypothetical protein [Bdellovibrionales bacterium]NQZ20305.1 hypothetical protein [Bdellovibrionales bacterium]